MLEELAKPIPSLPSNIECILAGTTERPPEYERFFKNGRKTFSLKWIKSNAGRALQMNAGAKASGGDFLWFVHADSSLDCNCLPRLLASIKEDGDHLHYFKLAFLSDGPKLVSFNAFFANIRADILGIPFGDQGFCLSRNLFFKLAGFDQNALHEDHHLIWKLRHRGYALKRVNATIKTSARKYRRKGWPYTTLLHLYMTYKYAIPNWLRLIKKKYS
ncbi:MAG: glycosyltransferase [Halobacteriovoraceae bacterium]|nr:glycosyltransferase [Halobacteriovoraceae bacterium]